jgi:uncharacterized protein (DUF1800 family)
MSRSPLAPIANDRWNTRTARHLLNRAGFGVPADRVEALAAMSPQDAVASLLNFSQFPYQPPPLPDLMPPEDYITDLREARSMGEEARRERSQELRRQERLDVAALQSWWLERLTTSPRPLEEKMTLFWHGHFATSAQKVQFAWAAWDLNETFRRHAVGNIKSLTIAVGQSLSMLRYLDNFRNVKQHPNENFARELLELFTLGVGNYTEQDVKEAARAFTGWTFNDGAFAYREDVHDFGPKVFLGQRGNFDGWDIIDIVFAQPAAAEFFARKIWSFFAHENPETDIVTALAEELRRNGYNLRPVLHTLFLSNAFYNRQAVANQIKSPVQFVVQLVHDLQFPSPPYAAMARATAALGQNLFYPPNVKGWDGGRQWINANTLLLRYNMPKALVSAGLDRERQQEMGMAMAPENMEERQRDRVRAMFAQLPREERRELRAELADANPRERREMVQEALLKRDMPNQWNAATLFPHSYYESAENCVDALSRRYLAQPLSNQNAQVLVEALGNGPIKPTELSRAKRDATLHLLFSSAEYQLC